MSDSPSPLEYLLVSSKTTIQSFELVHLNRASNLRKEMKKILDEWIQAEVDSRLARCVLECRRVLDDPRSGPARDIQGAIASPKADAALPPAPSPFEMDEILPASSGDKRLARRASAPVRAPARRVAQAAARDDGQGTVSRQRPLLSSQAAAAALRMLERFAMSRPGGAPLLEAELRRNGRHPSAPLPRESSLPSSAGASASQWSGKAGTESASGENENSSSPPAALRLPPHPGPIRGALRVSCKRGLAPAS